jgi:hypothetical protein
VGSGIRTHIAGAAYCTSYPSSDGSYDAWRQNHSFRNNMDSFAAVARVGAGAGVGVGAGVGAGAGFDRTTSRLGMQHASSAEYTCFKGTARNMCSVSEPQLESPVISASQAAYGMGDASAYARRDSPIQTQSNPCIAEVVPHRSLALTQAIGRCFPPTRKLPSMQTNAIALRWTRHTLPHKRYTWHATRRPSAAGPLLDEAVLQP